jgi:dolichol-phosphate mannosyltransferase
MKTRKNKLLSIVVPIFNESESIFEIFNRLNKVRLDFKRIYQGSTEIIFVDDGSSDSSFDLLSDIAIKYKFVKIISFTRNFGHQFAVTAGIDQSLGDHIAIIDCDLQDPPELIIDMYKLATKGFDVVYAVRSSRKGESFFKKITATFFYRFFNFMCNVSIPKDTGDFRLIGRNVADEFKLLKERHRFIRALIPWLGHKSVPIYYKRDERFAGVSKYPLRKMIDFATNAIFSFSAKPLKLTVRLGLSIIFLSILLSAYILYLRYMKNILIPGFAAIILAIVFFGGMNIFLIGLIGEYISRIFEEVKDRPLYVVDKKINF